MQNREKADFLAAYVEHRFNVRAAAEAVGRHYTTIYRQLRADEDFRAAFEEVRGALGDVALAEAVRRAVDGVDKPVYQGGELVGYIREYSDTLLRDILRATRFEFRDRSSIDLTSGGRPIQQQQQQTPALPADIERELRRRLLPGSLSEPIEGECEDVTDDEFEDLL